MTRAEKQIDSQPNIAKYGLPVFVIKSETGEMLLDVLGVPFGGPNNGRDSHNEYFDARSELWLDVILKRGIIYYHGLNQSEPEPIGEELSYEIRPDGVHFVVKLFENVKAAMEIWNAALKGQAFASAGSIGHLIRPPKNGWLSYWPIGEISLMSKLNGQTPANMYAVATPIAMKYIKSADPESLAKHIKHIGATQAQPSPIKATETVKDIIIEVPLKEELVTDLIEPTSTIEYNPEQFEDRITQKLEGVIVNTVADVFAKQVAATKAEAKAIAEAQRVAEIEAENIQLKAQAAARAEAENAQLKAAAAASAEAATKTKAESIAKTEAERVAGIEAEVTRLTAELATKTEAAPVTATVAPATDGTEQVVSLAPQPTPPATVKTPIITGTHPWEEKGIFAMGLAGELMKCRGIIPSSNFVRIFTEKSENYMNNRNTQSNNNYKRDIKADTKLLSTIKAYGANSTDTWSSVKADEITNTTNVGGGLEFINDVWSTRVVEVIRNEDGIMSRMDTREMTGKTLTVGVKTGISKMYQAAEITDQDQLQLATQPPIIEKVGTSNKVLTAKKATIVIGISDEQSEDSLLYSIDDYANDLKKDATYRITELLINGHVATDTTHINTFGASPNANSHLLLFDGFRQHALANNRTFDAATLTASDFVRAKQKLGNSGKKAADLFWILDTITYNNYLPLIEISTAANLDGVAGTFTSGTTQVIYDSPYELPDAYLDTDSLGHNNTTLANNTQGSFLLLRPASWILGLRRMVEIEMPARGAIQAVNGVQILIASIRLDMIAADLFASAYGINVNQLA